MQASVVSGSKTIVQASETAFGPPELLSSNAVFGLQKRVSAAASQCDDPAIAMQLLLVPLKRVPGRPKPQSRPPEQFQSHWNKCPGLIRKNG